MLLQGKTGWWALVAIGLVAALSACRDETAPVAPSPAATAASVYRMQFGEAPSSLDPLKASSAYANLILINVYDTLYRYQFLAEPYQLTPNLAVAMPVLSDDGLVVTIAIKKGVHFHDSDVFAGGKGRELRADDVVYSIKRHFVPNNFSDGAWLWQDYIEGVSEWQKQGAKLDHELSGLRAIDAYTLQFKLRQPMPTLLYTLATGFSAVLPKEVDARWNRDLARRAVGSGAFRLQSFDGSKATLTANRAFRKEAINLADEGYVAERHQVFGIDRLQGRSPPFLDQIEINFLSDASATLIALERGDLDSVRLSADLLPRVFEAAGIDATGLKLLPKWQQRVHHRDAIELGSAFISFNLLDPDLGMHGDKKINAAHRALRCALISAYDWDERNEKIYANTAISFSGVIPPGLAAFEPERLVVKTDLAAAKQMLADAGYTKDTLPVLRYGSTGSNEQRKIFELFRAQMLKIDYPLEKIQWQSFPSFGAFIEAVNRSEVMLQDMGWQLDAPDAENVLQLYYGPYKAPQINNANYVNPAFDRLFEQSRSMVSGTARTALHRQMNQLIVDDCAVLSGAARRFPLLWSKRFVAWPDNDAMVGRGMRFVAPVATQQ
jgi:oligopeptide transport system substrate-binding protein